jgi:hypothetical protein
MLRAQTRGISKLEEVFVTLDDEEATNLHVQAQPERNLTHSETNGGPSNGGPPTAPPTDRLDMRKVHK